MSILTVNYPKSYDTFNLFAELALFPAIYHVAADFDNGCLWKAQREMSMLRNANSTEVY